MKINWMRTRISMAALLLAGGAQAAIITHGATSVNMYFVSIGDSGNIADGNGWGAVGYGYGIGKYEVTIDQFVTAFNADNNIASGNENYWNTGTKTVGSDAPATFVSTYEGMKFSNWLTSGDAFSGAYTFSGGVFTGIDRAAAIATYGTVYVLPSRDEWHKAAYYTGNSADYWSAYANGTDVLPGAGTDANYNSAIGATTWAVGSGAMEQNGTYDMMGNVWEWTEQAVSPTVQVNLGGAFSTPNPATINSGNPASGADRVGLRVVAIPEPSSMGLIVVCALGALGIRRLTSC